LSIVVPVYNGASLLKDQLPDFIKYLDSINIRYEIIVVDDGSTDVADTKNVAEENGCRFLKNDVNLGKGAAVRKGMLTAKGDYRIYTDTDIPFHYDAINNFLFYLQDKEFDIVIGDRTLKESLYFTKISKNRKIGSAIFTFIVGRFITTGLFDTQCGLKGFRAEIADDLFSVSKIKGFAFDVELLYISLKRNYDIKRLPVKLRFNEGSSVKVIKHGIGMIFDLLKIKNNHMKGRYRWKEKS